MSEPVSVVIPVHGKVRLLGDALENLRRCARVPYEAIVVDDGTPGEEARAIAKVAHEWRVTLVRSEVNRGFAAAVNLGLAYVSHQLALLMNSDVRVSNNCIPSMQKRIAIGASVVGARLLYPDRRIQHGGVFFDRRSGLFDHRFRFLPGSVRAASRVDRWLVTGALMLLNRDILDVVGLFDESLFVAWEDVDFCLKVFEAGRWCCYDGEAEAIHFEGATRGTTPENKVRNWLEREQRAAETFFRRWAGYDFMRWCWR
jgi:GT2 family glycosyltransferase